MTKDSTEQLQNKIEANLNTFEINPTLVIGNGISAKVYKVFSEGRDQWGYTIVYYEDGLGVYKTAEFATFENLIAAMKALADDDLSLWEIADDSADVERTSELVATAQRIEINIGRGMSYSKGNNLFAFAREELHYDEIVYVISHSILSSQGGARVYNQNGDGEYNTLEELAVAMKKISGSLSLWKAVKE